MLSSSAILPGGKLRVYVISTSMASTQAGATVSDLLKGHIISYLVSFASVSAL